MIPSRNCVTACTDHRQLKVKPLGLKVPGKHSLASVVVIQRIYGVSLLVQRTNCKTA